MHSGEKLNLSSISFLANCQWWKSLAEVTDGNHQRIQPFHPVCFVLFLAKPVISYGLYIYIYIYVSKATNRVDRDGTITIPTKHFQS